jgi:hypothetical protein
MRPNQATPSGCQPAIRQTKLFVLQPRFMGTFGNFQIALQFITQQDSTNAINAASSPAATKAWTRVKLFPRDGIAI